MKVMRLKANLEDANGISNLLRDVTYSYLPTNGKYCYFSICRYEDSEYTFEDILERIWVVHPVQIEGYYTRCCIDTPIDVNPYETTG